MRNRNFGSRSALRKLALVSGSVMLVLVASAPVGQAAPSAGASQLAATIKSATPSPSPVPSTPKPKNTTITNPKPPGPGAPRAGTAPKQSPSRLQRALVAAGVSAPAAALPAAPCSATGTALTCTLWAKAGTLTLPAQAQTISGIPGTVVAPLTIPTWGFATSAAGAAEVPGPVLIAYADQTISIHVYNQLPPAPNGENSLSIEVPASGARPDLTGIERLDDRTWNFGTLSPGTYLYEAGPAPFGPRQVRMGLGGLLVVRPAAATFQACSCAYGNAARDGFVDESTMVLNEFDPAFNADPFGFDPVEFSPTEFTMNGLAYDPANPSAGAIDVLGGTFDILLLHYANLTDHERGITIANERQNILADDSRLLTNPVDVATKWLNPGQVSDSFITIDPSFTPNMHVPVYDAGFHFSNGPDTGLGGMFTYLNVVQGSIGSPSGPVTTVGVSPSTNSGIEDLAVAGTITASSGASLTDAEWFLDDPSAPGSAQTCPTGGLSLTNGGSRYTFPIVTISGGGGTGAAATVSGSIDAVNVTAGGGGYTAPSVTIAGASATASGSVDAVKLTTTGSHYSTPSVNFSGGGGAGAAAKATGQVDSLTLGTPGAGYTAPNVVLTGDGTGASATVSGSVDTVTLTSPGSHYTSPVGAVTGSGTGAAVSVSGVVDSLTVVTAGSGYTAPVVSISGGGGSGASATAQFDATTGAITGLTIITAGSGFTSAPAITINDTAPGPGSGATAGSTISVSSITLGAGGSGYGSAPSVAITDSAGGFGAAAVSTISVTSITLDAGGSNYSSAPAVAINDSGTLTTAATATSTIGVTGLTLTAGGTGYTFAPAVTISDTLPGTGTGASATATLSVTTITVNAGGAGSGYTSAPAVTISDTIGTGTLATAVATLTLTAITLTNPGAGYRTAPTVLIADSGLGSGATAIATLPASTCIYQHFAVSGSTANYSFTIASADLNNLLLAAINRDGDHIIWVRAEDSSGTAGTWGVVSGDVFTYNATGPVVGALTLHLTPTNGLRPTDVANGAGLADPITGMYANVPSNDLVILGMVGASLSNFMATSAEYCIDTNPCPPIPNTSNPSGPTPIVLTPSGTSASTFSGTASGVSSTGLTDTTMVWAPNQWLGATVSMGGSTLVVDNSTAIDLNAAAGWAPTVPTAGTYTISNFKIDSYGNALATPSACVPLPAPPGLGVQTNGGAPGGGSVVSFCATVASSVLMSLSEGPHTLFIRACEQLATSTTPCVPSPSGPARWSAFNADASIQFVFDKTGPVIAVNSATHAPEISVDPNPNNGYQATAGNLNFVDVLLLSATFTDPTLPRMTTGSNIGYAEAFVTCSPRTQPCQSGTSANPDANPIDPTTGAVPPDGTGAEMHPSGGAWDAPTKLGYAYVPLAELTAFKEGYVRFWVHAQDEAGNFGGWFFTDLTYDKTAPLVTAPSTKACAFGCTITFAANDPISNGVHSSITQAEYFVGPADPGFGNGIQIPAAGPLVLGPQPAGTSISLRVKDEAGNWSLNSVIVTT